MKLTKYFPIDIDPVHPGLYWCLISDYYAGFRVVNIILEFNDAGWYRCNGKYVPRYAIEKWRGLTKEYK